MVVDLFAIIYVGLHFRLRKHAYYRFEGLLSNGIIYGTALFSLVHLVFISLN